MRLRPLAALLLLVMAVPAAAAHANYLSSHPARGARLDVAPTDIHVTLSEDVDPSGSSLEVRDASGHRLDEGPVRVEGGATPTLSVRVRIPGPGSYTVTWISLSSVDGHSTRGSFGFAVGDYEPPATVESSGTVNAGGVAGRWLLYAGFALALGALAFRLLVDPGPSSRRHAHARILTGGTSLIALGVTVLLWDTKADAGLSWAGLTQSSVGVSLLVRLLLALLAVAAAVVAARMPTPRRLTAVAILVLGAAVWTARLGHPADHGWLGTSLDLLHLVAAAVWIGGLACMAHALFGRSAGGGPEMARVAHRFSTLALVSVTVLVASGTATAILVLGASVLRDPGSLLQHSYGRILLWKIGLLGAMLVLASVNRFVHLGEGPLPRRRLPAKDPGPRMARAVAVEALLGVAVLVAASLLTAGSPPSAAPAAAAAWSVHGEGDAYTAELESTGAPSGGRASNITLHIHDRSTGAPLEEAIRVRFVLSWSDAPELGTEERLANQTGNGTWTIRDAFFSRAGEALVTVEVQTQQVYLDRVPFHFRVEDVAPS